MLFNLKKKKEIIPSPLCEKAKCFTIRREGFPARDKLDPAAGEKKGFCRLMLKKLLFTLCLTVLVMLSASAEEIPVYDFREDQASYAALSAEMTRRKADAPLLRAAGGSGTGTAVLCAVREGAELPFEELDMPPQCVLAGPGGRYTLMYRSEQQAERAAEQLSLMPGVRYAEADGRISASFGGSVQTAQPTGQDFYSYGASVQHYDAMIGYAQTWGTGESLIAVIDSGAVNHAVYRNRIREGGYDYVDGDEDPSNDENGHGTNVTGILADCTKGAEVAICPIRILDAGAGGQISNAVNAIYDAIAMGADVINLSMETEKISEALDAAVLDAVDAGVTVVAAAGNGGGTTENVSPAHLMSEGVIIVGAARRAGTVPGRISYSNTGESVDLYAYGAQILCCAKDGGMEKVSGTSMAVPHISALCAMLRLIHPALTPEQTQFRLLAAAPGTAVNVPDAGKMVPAGEGIDILTLRGETGYTLPLPRRAYPEESCEDITCFSSDESIARVEAEKLVLVSPGSAEITVTCTGFADAVFTVTVAEQAPEALLMPKSLTAIGEEAFFGSARGHAEPGEKVTRIGDRAFDGCGELWTVYLPASLEDIGEGDFSGAVLLCEGEERMKYALEHGLPYVLLPDAGEEEE